MLEIKKHIFPHPEDKRVIFRDWHGNYRMSQCLNAEFNTMLDKRENEIIARG